MMWWRSCSGHERRESSSGNSIPSLTERLSSTCPRCSSRFSTIRSAGRRVRKGEKRTAALRRFACLLLWVRLNRRNDDLFFIPTRFTLTEFVQFYASCLLLCVMMNRTIAFPVSDPPFLVYMDGKCYCPERGVNSATANGAGLSSSRDSIPDPVSPDVNSHPSNDINSHSPGSNSTHSPNASPTHSPLNINTSLPQSLNAWLKQNKSPLLSSLTV